MPNFSSWEAWSGVGHVGEDTGMDMRVKGLDAAIKAFRETSDFGDLGHFDTQLSQTLRGGTGGKPPRCPP